MGMMGMFMFLRLRGVSCSLFIVVVVLGFLIVLFVVELLVSVDHPCYNVRMQKNNL